MSDIIQLLPDSVANQIAAGEVIQRPASVIKELVENAVDAGATTINVMVVDAGRTSIQVIDDGKGMSDTDARLSFERHATSKIRDAADLFALHTMGFRGEALASIAAVAQVELRTRTEDQELGTHLTIAGSRFLGQEPCACPKGSNFLVENLFYNVPARRKFLKSNATELNNIVTAFQRIVLVYPQITFTLHSNGTELYHLRATGLRQRVVDLFGSRINPQLLPIKIDTTVCSVLGFVGKPESARKKGAQQYFFVNGRYMRHPYFHRAVMQAFDRLIPTGDQVPYFIYFDVPAGDIDVNIHPTKTEIKFENEQAIFQLLTATVKDAVGMFHDVGTLEFDTEGRPDIPVFDPSQAVDKLPSVDLDPNYNPFSSLNEPLTEDFSRSTTAVGTSSASRLSSASSPHSSSTQWEQLYEGLKGRPKAVEAPLFPEETIREEHPLSERSPLHFQYKGRYIITSVKSGLMIVDQYRAHVRILFDHYERLLSAHKVHAQKLVFPQTVDLNPQQFLFFTQVQSQLQAAGFEITQLGGGTVAVHAIPEGMEGTDAPTLLTEVLEAAAAGADDVMKGTTHALALSLARHGATPYGRVLSNEEMESLVNQLFGCVNTRYTPSGQPIMTILPQEQMEKMLE